MSITDTILEAGNLMMLFLFLVLTERRTKTLVYWFARWAKSSGEHPGESTANSPGRLRLRFGQENAEFFQDKATGCWMFEMDGYPAVELSVLPARLRGALSLGESISLMGAQPCCFFAEAVQQGHPGPWFGHFQDYVFALDRAIWRKSIRSFVAFQDHTAVVRLISLRHAANVFQRELLLPANRRLRKIITALQARDLALLLEKRLFDYQTNHGLITCLGLLHYALDLSEDARRPIVLRVAHWMGTREDFFFSDDGVPLEIAQTYWKLIFQLMTEIAELLNAFGQRVNFSKLHKVEEFFAQYSIDARVNRFGNSELAHDLHLASHPKRSANGVACRVFDTGLFVAEFVAGDRVRSQLVLNAQDVRPWIHGQQSQMAMGYFSDEVFWVDSPGRFTSGKKGIKARIDHYTNQSLPIREGYGYVPGWRFVGVDETSAGVCFFFSLSRMGPVLLERRLTIGREGGFTINDSAPGGVVVSRFLLHPGATAVCSGATLLLTAEGRQVAFDFMGAPAIEEGLISFERNVALPTKIFALRGEQVQLAFGSLSPFPGGLRACVSPGYPYLKREFLAQSHPNSLLQQISVKKLQFAIIVLLVTDLLVLALF